MSLNGGPSVAQMRTFVRTEAYVDNKLDRGHVARRADLVWGAAAEADRANRDSFFFTNITPQHQAFNQSTRFGLWGRLEDAIYDDVDVLDLHLSLIGGPIFKSKDRTHRGVRIPSDYWKIVAFVDDDDDKTKVKAYVLTQNNLLDDIEALDLDEFRIYQVSIDELERLTDLRFPKLKPYDDFNTGRVPESTSATRGRRPVREVHSEDDVVV